MHAYVYTHTRAFITYALIYKSNLLNSFSIAHMYIIWGLTSWDWITH